MKPPARLAFHAVILAVVLAGGRLLAADPVFSGPQPGESITPFHAVELSGGTGRPECDPVSEVPSGRPLALVFVHVIERSLAPLLRAIDQFGAEKKDQLTTELVFLTADRLEGERRVRAAVGALKLQSRASLSVEGAEGPGNFGLNKECMMTIVTAKDRKVLTNFALVQPGIADAAAVLTAMARATGDVGPVDVTKYAQPRKARMEPRKAAPPSVE